jgi:hypothetical protein
MRGLSRRRASAGHCKCLLDFSRCCHGGCGTEFESHESAGSFMVSLPSTQSIRGRLPGGFAGDVALASRCSRAAHASITRLPPFMARLKPRKQILPLSVCGCTVPLQCDQGSSPMHEQIRQQVSGTLFTAHRERESTCRPLDGNLLFLCVCGVTSTNNVSLHELDSTHQVRVLGLSEVVPPKTRKLASSLVSIFSPPG